jgi:hypothetical protein
MRNSQNASDLPMRLSSSKACVLKLKATSKNPAIAPDVIAWGKYSVAHHNKNSASKRQDVHFLSLVIDEIHHVISIDLNPA